ncbi:MarR family winged helix-turn-helix transcriptional regulator [Micromonospora chokoriensis]
MEDSVDRHVQRWRDWAEISFDVEVEAVVTRISRLAKHLKGISRRAANDVGLQWPEYETLHELMVRTTPGQATPTQLAEQLMLSAAAITGRLDSMENAGLLRRVRSERDRRRLDVEISEKGRDRWRQAMALRDQHERALVAVLPPQEQSTINRLLRMLLASLEDDAGHHRTPRGAGQA